MLSFYEFSQTAHNNALIKEWLESIASRGAELQLPKDLKPQADEKLFYRARSRGELLDNDPIKRYANTQKGGDINIVWITGMWSGTFPGTGKYTEFLRPLGYNLRVIRTLADLKTATMGRLSRYWPFKMLNQPQQTWATQHVTRNQEKVTKELEDTSPDLIIGSSQGGAIALSIAEKYPNIPMILLCPAWKVFKVTPKYLHPQSVIIHGVRDTTVPIEDSQELADMFQVRLIPTNDKHIMKEGLSVLVKILRNMTAYLSKTKIAESTHEPKVNIWFA